MDFNQLSQEVLDEMHQDGTVKKILRARMEKTVAEVADGLLGSYSDFGKRVTKEVGGSLNIDLANLNLQDYGAIISNIVADTLRDSAHESATVKVQEAVRGVVGKLDKKEWRLSELVNEFKAAFSSFSISDSGEVHYSVEETDYGSVWIRLSEERKKDRYSDDDFRMLVGQKTGEIFNYWQAGKVPNLMVGTPENGEFNKLMFRLWAAGAKIIIDEDDIDTSYGHGH